jgi:hypothetical protein
MEWRRRRRELGFKHNKPLSGKHAITALHLLQNLLCAYFLHLMCTCHHSHITVPHLWILGQNSFFLYILLRNKYYVYGKSGDA